jgi:hypothetical protein
VRAIITILSLLRFALVLLCSCSNAGSLVGEWRSDSIKWTPPQSTNQLELYTSVTFSKEGSFETHNFINTQPRTELPVPLKGTYNVLDTNTMMLQIAPNDAFPSNRIPLTVTYSLSEDVLTLPALPASPVSRNVTYRRVMKK